MSTRLLTEPIPEITLRGSAFCFTGEFSHHRRVEYEHMVRAARGRVWKEVECVLDYLVIGDGSLCGPEEIEAILQHTKVRTALQLNAFGDLPSGPVLGFSPDGATGEMTGHFAMHSTHRRPCLIRIVSETTLQLALGV